LGQLCYFRASLRPLHGRVYVLATSPLLLRRPRRPLSALGADPNPDQYTNEHADCDSDSDEYADRNADHRGDGFKYIQHL
jgi:hypothetical protein